MTSEEEQLNFERKDEDNLDFGKLQIGSKTKASSKSPVNNNNNNSGIIGNKQQQRLIVHHNHPNHPSYQIYHHHPHHQQQDISPPMSVWKDYPQIQNSPSHSPTPSCYSYYEGYPPPPPPYLHHNNNIPHTGYFSYKSSSVASIFGGRKSLISPPKFYPYQQQYPTRYYGNPPVQINEYMSPYFPISRSSSQSSGFISHECSTPTPPPPGNGNSPDNERNSVFSEPTIKSTNCHFYSNGGYASEMAEHNLSFSSGEYNLRHRQQPWVNSTGNLRMEAGYFPSTSGANRVCSRFGPKINDMDQNEDNIFSEDDDDDDDDNTSFELELLNSKGDKSSAATSSLASTVITKRSGKIDQQKQRDNNSRRVSTEKMKRKIPKILAKKNEDVFKVGKEDKQKSFLFKLLITISILLNVCLFFWLIFGDPFDEENRSFQIRRINYWYNYSRRYSSHLYDRIYKIILSYIDHRQPTNTRIKEDLTFTLPIIENFDNVEEEI